MESPPAIFDRRLIARRRARLASELADADFLLREVAERLAERLDDLTARFPTALVLGARGGVARDVLTGRAGEATLVELELTADALRGGGLAAVADIEALPAAKGAFDLVFAPFDLHTANDLPGVLAQARQALKPDGLFLGAVLGPATLAPLRQAFLEAEAMLDAPATPHISPFIDIRDAAGLLQRAGFALPVADAETIDVAYASPLKLLQDLRNMGEANVLEARSRRPLRREVLLAALARLAAAADPDTGRVTIPFEVIFMAGWSPAASQQKPLARGSGEVSLATALNPKSADED